MLHLLELLTAVCSRKLDQAVDSEEEKRNSASTEEVQVSSSSVAVQLINFDQAVDSEETVLK